MPNSAGQGAFRVSHRQLRASEVRKEYENSEVNRNKGKSWHFAGEVNLSFASTSAGGGR